MKSSSVAAHTRQSLRRHLFFVLLSAGVGIVAGGLRAVVGFIPVMHGMFFGSLLAWLAGQRARGDPPAWWSSKQHFWTWLNLFMTCTLFTLITLSLLYRRPMDGPLDWLSGVMRGYGSEPFFGARPVGSVEGVLSGGGWIAFNALDLLLFFGVGFIVLGVAVDKHLPANRGKKKKNPSGSTAAATAGTPRPSARRWFCVQWIVVVLIFAVPQLPLGRRVPVRLDPAAQDRLAALTGRYLFEDGGGLIETRGQGGAFVVRRHGFDGLIVVSEPADRYAVVLTYDGRSFSGRLMREGSSPAPVHARTSRDGRRFLLAGPVYRRHHFLRDALIEARKE